MADHIAKSPSGCSGLSPRFGGGGTVDDGAVPFQEGA